VAIFIFFVRLDMMDNPTNLLFVHTLICMPFVVTVMTAAFHNFEWEQQEAAMDLGARPLRTFLKVILPQLSSHVAIASLLAFIISFDQVETSLFMVRPGSATLPIEMFLYLQRAQDPTIAALSTLLILFSIVLLALVSLFMGKRKMPLGLTGDVASHSN
jgi:putative spermidine/putrescine transport system permease protein